MPVVSTGCNVNNYLIFTNENSASASMNLKKGRKKLNKQYEILRNSTVVCGLFCVNKLKSMSLKIAEIPKPRIKSSISNLRARISRRRRNLYW